MEREHKKHRTAYMKARDASAQKKAELKARDASAKRKAIASAERKLIARFRDRPSQLNTFDVQALLRKGLISEQEVRQVIQKDQENRQRSAERRMSLRAKEERAALEKEATQRASQIKRERLINTLVNQLLRSQRSAKPNPSASRGV
jgi:hypothetical protein